MWRLEIPTQADESRVHGEELLSHFSLLPHTESDLRWTLKEEFRQENIREKLGCKHSTQRVLLLYQRESAAFRISLFVESARLRTEEMSMAKMKGNKYIYKHHKETIHVYLPQNKPSVTKTRMEGVQESPNVLTWATRSVFQTKLNQKHTFKLIAVQVPFWTSAPFSR